METLQIRKKSDKVWLHRVFVDGTLIPSNDSIISKFYCKTFGDVFKIVEDSGSNRKEYNYTNISVFDDTYTSTEEVFGSSQALMLRLEELKYVGFNRDGDVPELALEDLTNITITIPSTGEVLIYNSGTSKWENQSIPAIPSTTDSLAEGVTNFYFTAARVLATVLTGISFATGGAIVSTDTVLQAFGKIQKQITDALASISLKQDILTDVNFGSFINGLASKTTPVDADYSIEMDSADGNKLKKVSWANRKATLKTYFDTQYSTNPSILQKLGGASRFTLPTTNNYPFLGAAINGGALTTGYNFSPFVTNQYSNNYLILTAGSAGSGRGYKFTASGQNSGLWQGFTYFSIIMPFTITDITSRFGIPHTGTFTANVENLNGGAWFNIVNGNLIARTASSGASSSGSTVAINNQEWLMLMIEVVANPTGGGSQSILFKAKKLDGTVVYNESITTTILAPSATVYSQLECGFITTKGTPSGNDGLLCVCHSEFWASKPSHLISF